MLKKSGIIGKIEAVGTLEPKASDNKKTASIEDLRKRVAEDIKWQPTGEGKKDEK